MKKMRKFISLAVVFTMLCSLILPGIAFANTSDIEGTKYEEAIVKLVALGTIKGYEDGTFRPETTITRAELATVITFVLGLQDAAELSKTTPSPFSDVKVNEWYTGYINIAANENVFAGYPDGTFRPSQEVSYSEAVTMLVNALGLKPVVDKSGGTWPNNYMSKAAQLGITKDITGVDGKSSALRGDVFIMAWETLLQNKWGETGFNDLGEITYGNLGKTLLEIKYPDFVYQNEHGKMEAKYFEEILVVSTPETNHQLEANQIEIELENIADMLKVTTSTPSKDKVYKSDDSGDRIVIILPSDVDASDLLGKEVTIFFGKDNTVSYIKATDEAMSNSKLETIKASSSKVKVDGKEYTVLSDAKIYINSIEITDAITASETIDNADVKTKLAYVAELKESLDDPLIKANMLLNSSNKITSLQLAIAGTFTIETEDDSDSDYEFIQFTAKNIRSDSTVVDLNGTRQFKIDDVDDEDSNIIVKKNGKAAKAEDIEIGNVIMVSKKTDGNIRLITITDNTVTGMLDKITSSYGLRIDGTVYEKGANAMLSTENDLDEVVAMSSDVSTLIDNEVTLHLDSNGAYVLAMGESEVTLAGQYGIVGRTPVASDIMYDDDDDPYLRLQIVDEKGNKVAYKISGDSKAQFKQVKDGDIVKVEPSPGEDWTDALIDEFTKGTLVKFSTDSDGRTVKVNNLIKLENESNAPSLVEMNDSDVLSKLTIEDEDNVVKNSTKSFKDADGKTYYVTDKTVILNQHADNIEVVSGWNILVNNNDENSNMLRGTTPLAIYNANSRIIKYLIIDDDGSNYQATEDKYGIITNIEVSTNSDGDKVWMVTVYTEGEEMTYEVADVQTDISTVLFGEEGDLVRYDIENNKFVQTGETDIKIDMSAFLDDDNYDEFISDGIADRDQLVVDEILGNLVVFKKLDGEAIEPISVSDDVIVYDLSDPDAPQMSNMDDLEGRMIMYFDTDGDDSEYEILIILE
ncbi:MAG: S-layer homology domain-containing protein [Clostridia bacterium]|nr:S-layer homology domain-containing protein [Clostridia bacterium]